MTLIEQPHAAGHAVRSRGITHAFGSAAMLVLTGALGGCFQAGGPVDPTSVASDLQDSGPFIAQVAKSPELTAEVQGDVDQAVNAASAALADAGSAELTARLGSLAASIDAGDQALESQVTDLQAGLDRVQSQVDALDGGLGQQAARLDALTSMGTSLSAQLGALDAGVVSLAQAMDAGFTTVGKQIDGLIATTATQQTAINALDGGFHDLQT